MAKDVALLWFGNNFGSRTQWLPLLPRATWHLSFSALLLKYTLCVVDTLKQGGAGVALDALGILKAATLQEIERAHV